MSYDILESFARRHSFYDINNKIPIKSEEFEAIIRKCMELYPSSFNTQSARLLILYEKQHLHFWSLVENELLKTAPKNKIEAIKKRINSFANGYGTILFFDDNNIVRELENKMPLYADNFKNWSHQGNAILQFMIWCALSDENIGASMQHYNPLVDSITRSTFNVPQSWELIAQMPFGGIKHYPFAHSVEEIDPKMIIKR